MLAGSLLLLDLINLRFLPAGNKIQLEASFNSRGDLQAGPWGVSWRPGATGKTCSGGQLWSPSRRSPRCHWNIVFSPCLDPRGQGVGSQKLNMEAKSPPPRGGDGHGQETGSGHGRMTPKFRWHSSMLLPPRGGSLNLQLLILVPSPARLYPLLWGLTLSVVIWYPVRICCTRPDTVSLKCRGLVWLSPYISTASKGPAPYKHHSCGLN